MVCRTRKIGITTTLHNSFLLTLLTPHSISLLVCYKGNFKMVLIFFRIPVLAFDSFKPVCDSDQLNSILCVLLDILPRNFSSRVCSRAFCISPFSGVSVEVRDL